METDDNELLKDHLQDLGIKVTDSDFEDPDKPKKPKEIEVEIE